MRGSVQVVRRVLAVALIVVGGVFLIAALALLVQGEWVQLVTAVLSVAVMFGGWRLWPRRTAGTAAPVRTRGPVPPADSAPVVPLRLVPPVRSSPRAVRAAAGVAPDPVTPVPGSPVPVAYPAYPAGSIVPGAVDSADFTALDVETANEQRASICAIAVVRVRDGRVVDRGSWLVQPPAGFDTFLPRNVGIHGITADMVTRTGQSWPAVLGEVMHAVGGDVVVAHNASFDMQVVRAATQACGLPIPAITYADSLALARRVMPGLADGYALPALARACGVTQVAHHDAGDDARVCAEITTHLLSLGLVAPQPFPAPGGRPGASLPPNPDADPAHPLCGVFVCITGELDSMTRRQAREELARVGANHRPNVSRKTAYLVCGKRTGAELTSSGGEKLLRAKAMQADGHPIQIITEEQFLSLLHDA